MKKLAICAIIAFSCVWVAQAQAGQNDTILVVSNNVRIEKETFESTTGKFHVNYLALIDGEWYYTNKSSYDRYYKCKKFGGKPNLFFVKPKESKVKTVPRVIVL